MLMLGGFNAAKTWGGIIKLLILLDTFANSRAAVVRATYKHLRKTTMETFYSICPPEAYSRGRRSDQDGICQLNNGSLIHFIGLDKPESVDILAGLEINFGFVDQAEQVIEKVWDTLDARVGRWAQAKIPQRVLDEYPEGWPWTNDAGDMVPPPFLFATANPPESEDHWLFVRFAEESEERDRWAREGYHFMLMPSYSNRFASKANLARLRSKDPEFVRRYYEGLWSNPEGTIFDISPLSLLDPHPDLVKRITNNMNLHRSMDHGDSSPTCVAWEGIDHDGNIFVYREHYAGGLLVSEHRDIVWAMSKNDVPTNSPYLVPRYKSNIADPSIFSLSRGRTATAAPSWSVADEWTDTRSMLKETKVYWTPAPIPKVEGISYELATRARMKEYLRVDPNHRHPITGQLGAPRLYFLRKTADYPNGCYYIIKEIRGQRRVKIGERDGRSIYSDERDDTVPDHGYDTIKYHLITRPSPSRIVEKTDPNVFSIQEIMEWTSHRQRMRARVSGGY